MRDAAQLANRKHRRVAATTSPICAQPAPHRCSWRFNLDVPRGGAGEHTFGGGGPPAAPKARGRTGGGNPTARQHGLHHRSHGPDPAARGIPAEREGWIEELKNSSASNRLPWQFNAKELDETGLYYYGARYYNVSVRCRVSFPRRAGGMILARDVSITNAWS